MKTLIVKDNEGEVKGRGFKVRLVFTGIVWMLYIYLFKGLWTIEVNLGNPFKKTV